MNVKRLSARPLLRFYVLVFCVTLVLLFPAGLLPMERALTVNAIAPLQSDPSVVGAWSSPVDWGLVVIHSHVLPNGKVLFWTRDQAAQGGDVLGSTQARVWDPATGAFTLVPNFNTNLFCSGHSFLPDGRLLVAGGHQRFDGHGEPHTNIFDFNTNTWTRMQDMNAGRWYPTTCPLGSGEVLTVSGAYWDGTLNPATAKVTCDNSYDLFFNGSFMGSGANWMQAQTFSLPMQVGKNVVAIRCSDAGGLAGLLAELNVGGQLIGSNASWKVSLTAPANWTDVNFDDSSWANASDYGAYGVFPWGTNVSGMPTNTPARWIWSSNNDAHNLIFVRVSFNDNPGSHHLVNNSLPQVWQPSTGTWRSLTTANEIGQDLYPWMLLAPTGQVFNSGPTQTTRYLRTSGTGAWTFVANSNFGFRDYGSSVMYDDGRVLIAGGGTPTKSAEVINLNKSSVISPTITPNPPTPTWDLLQDEMENARRQMNLTILADGKVLATGGTSSGGFSTVFGSVFSAELWDPDTETWSTMASMQTRRLYHSTAVLLPDGRVLSAGGGHPPSDGGDINHTDVELYSPPYLFRGPRPTITSAPTVANHGEQFFVGTPDAAGISRVTLVRLSSVTHAFNQDQRINYLSFQKTASGLNVTASGGSNLCPPGYYMLFIINGNGVPSVARIIQVTTPASPKNSIDDSQYFVRMQYQDFFDRSPDRPGLDFWTGTITECGNNPSCKGGKRTNVSRAFWESTEFQTPLRNANDPLFFPTPPNGLPYNTNEFVKKCYRIYLRREGDPGGVNFWTNGLNSCIANNPGNPSGCYNNTISAFIASGDYRNRFHKP
ncbi:MAG TPA: galactose oxidase-like domain-containing protein [Blastocatellia bacterium]|nr:galactose oxidase-like domain-containing protein [Blastocatellia bacterium]